MAALPTETTDSVHGRAYVRRARAHIGWDDLTIDSDVGFFIALRCAKDVPMFIFGPKGPSKLQ